jgi:hypothetical protein
MKNYKKEYGIANAEKVKATSQKYREENREYLKRAKAAKYLRTREHCIAKVKENYAKNKDKILAYGEKYRAENKERLKAQQREYVKKNWDSKKEYMRKYVKERKENDPVFAMSLRLRGRMSIFFRKKGFAKPDSTYKLIGCSYVELVEHLESKFTEGMSWDNRSEWHIDHIIPLASAKTIEEVSPLFHYSNLQPLWALDNRLKGARMPEEEAA